MSNPVGQGHNSFENISDTSVAGDELKAFVNRIERVEEEINGLNDDKKEIYGEMKGCGFDVKVVKHIIGIRRKDRAELQEFESIKDLYLNALGMVI